MTPTFSQPTAQHRDGVFAKWGASGFSSFAQALHVRTGTQDNILTAQAGKFLRAQSGLHGQQQQGSIASSAPGAEVRRSEQGLDFDRRKSRLVDVRTAYFAWRAHAAPTRCTPARATRQSERTSAGRRDAHCGCGHCCRDPFQDDRERRRGMEYPYPVQSTVKVFCAIAVVRIASASVRCRGSLRWCGGSPVAAASVDP